MKKCPYCAESIQNEAVKCRFCGEFLAKSNPEKWYFKPYFLVIAFFCIGPFMLPLVWLHPGFNRAVKIILSAAIILISILLGFLLVKSLMSISRYYKQMFSVNM